MSATQLISQRQSALARAQEIRLRRARERHEIETLGRPAAAARPAALILVCPDWLQSILVEDLLCWQKRIGTRAASKLLRGRYYELDSNGELMAADNDIPSVKQLGQLTDRQRRLLAARVIR